MSRGPKVVDLFHGAGGFTLGAQAAGCEVVVGVERWAPAVATSRAAGHRVIEADVADVGAYIELARGADIVIGGPPCQPFSSAGDHGGEDDERDGFPAAFAAVDAIRPRAMILENVRGLLWDRHRAYREHLLAQARERFAWAGLIELDAADFGVPQHRGRVFIVGSERPVRAPARTHRDPAEPVGLFDDLPPWVSMGEALGIAPGSRIVGGGRNASDGTRSYRYLEGEPSTTVTAAQIGNAGPWVVAAQREARIWERAGDLLLDLETDEDDPDAWPLRREALATCILDHEHLLNRPAPAISATEAKGAGARAYRATRGEPVDGSFDRASCALMVSTGRRRLTPAECAILQDFPAGYPWQGTKTDIYRQIGNAVPKRLGAAIVGAVMRSLR